MSYIFVFCILLFFAVSCYTAYRTNLLINQMQMFYLNVVQPQLLAGETEFTEKEKAFSDRIDKMRNELYSLPKHPAEILHPDVYNIEDTPLSTYDLGEEVAD